MLVLAAEPGSSERAVNALNSSPLLCFLHFVLLSLLSAPTNLIILSLPQISYLIINILVCICKSVCVCRPEVNVFFSSLHFHLIF